MLPFMMAKKMGSVVQAVTKPEGGVESVGEEGEPHPELMAASEDLISAVHAKDAKAVAMALEAAYGVCDSSMDMSDGEEDDE